jgi:spore coat protein A, manganese oxidase
MKRLLTSIFGLLLVSLNCPALSTVWDYDGDGKTDLVIFRSDADGSGGYTIRWYIEKSRDGFFTIQWGSTSPVACGSSPVAGDFDGDGKTDIASVGKCAGSDQMYYYVLNSSNNTMRVTQWGLLNDQRMLEDFDGDGKTDFGVYRGGWWYILNSSDGSFRAEQFGIFNSEFSDIAIYGDYDGDGKADLAVARYRNVFVVPTPITLIVKLSGSGNWFSYTMGNRLGDWVVPGDYDGDGKTDFALYGGKNIEYGDARFRVIQSSDGQFVSVRFGHPLYDDQPIPSDFDGDGKTDFAVYRRGDNNPQNYFYILGSSSGFQAIPWGSAAFFDLTPMTQMNSNY